MITKIINWFKGWVTTNNVTIGGTNRGPLLLKKSFPRHQPKYIVGDVVKVNSRKQIGQEIVNLAYVGPVTRVVSTPYSSWYIITVEKVRSADGTPITTEPFEIMMATSLDSGSVVLVTLAQIDAI